MTGQRFNAPKGPWGWQYIAQGVGDNSANDLNFRLDSRYQAFQFIGTGLDPATDDSELWCRLSDDNRVSYEAGDSDYSWATRSHQHEDAPTDLLSGDTLDNQIVICSDDGGANQAIGNADDEGASFMVWVTNHASAILGTTLMWTASYSNAEATTLQVAVSGTGMHELSAAGGDDGIQFLMESGNIVLGTIVQLGLLIPPA